MKVLSRVKIQEFFLGGGGGGGGGGRGFHAIRASSSSFLWGGKA